MSLRSRAVIILLGPIINSLITYYAIYAILTLYCEVVWMIFAILTFTQLRIPIFHFTKHTDVEIQICEEISIPQFIIYISEVRRKNFEFSLKLVTLKRERKRERQTDRERERERKREREKILQLAVWSLSSPTSWKIICRLTCQGDHDPDMFSKYHYYQVKT